MSHHATSKALDLAQVFLLVLSSWLESLPVRLVRALESLMTLLSTVLAESLELLPRFLSFMFGVEGDILAV